jgi:hypothetical protein
MEVRTEWKQTLVKWQKRKVCNNTVLQVTYFSYIIKMSASALSAQRSAPLISFFGNGYFQKKK